MTAEEQQAAMVIAAYAEVHMRSGRDIVSAVQLACMDLERELLALRARLAGSGPSVES